MEKINLFLADAAGRSSDGHEYGTGIPKVAADWANLKVGLQVVFGVAAAIALLVILLGALKFITAQGDPQEVAKGRSMILYAAIGLVVALSAEAIVMFAIGSV